MLVNPADGVNTQRLGTSSLETFGFYNCTLLFKLFLFFTDLISFVSINVDIVIFFYTLDPMILTFCVGVLKTNIVIELTCNVIFILLHTYVVLEIMDTRSLLYIVITSSLFLLSQYSINQVSIQFSR